VITYSLTFVKDKWVIVAMLAGPLAWFALWALGVDIDWAAPPWSPFLLTALLYPILEEIVFRGGLQATLLKRDWGQKRWVAGITLANIATSIAFTALHFISQPPMWASLVFLPSLIFGWARDRFDNVLPSIILHIVYNAGFAWLFVQFGA